MKKTLIIVLTLVCLASAVFFLRGRAYKSLFTGNSVVLSKNTVVIDAGHGGRDAGTSAADGTPEKQINLEMALKLHDFLKVSGIDCVLLREGDYQVYYDEDNRNRSDLYNRLDFVNAIPNSVLISIHQNYFENPSEWGTQIWYSANTPQSKILADNILNTIKTNLQPDNQRLNKESDSSYYLLYQAKVPSIMIEGGFMSNPQENELLKNREYQNKMAYSILLGICGEV